MSLNKFSGSMRGGQVWLSCAKLLLSIGWLRFKGFGIFFITNPGRVYGTMGGSD